MVRPFKSSGVSDSNSGMFASSSCLVMCRKSTSVPLFRQAWWHHPSLGRGTLRSCLPGRAQTSRRRLLFEEHWRRTIFRTNAVDDFLKRFGEALPLRVRHLIENAQQTFLGHGRGLLQHGPAGPGQLKNEASCIALVAVAGNEARLDQTGHDDGDGALVGACPGCKVAQRQSRSLAELRQHEKLGA